MKILKGLRPISALLLLLFTVEAARAQDGIKYRELPNFYKVNATLYRGGQPTEEGYKILASLGIKTVLNLRDSDERARAEEGDVLRAGMRYFNVPLDIFGKPSDERVDSVLAIIRAPENQPIFVHCKRGSDRTGVIIACYRISQDGWTSEQAKDEAKRFGIGFWQFRMKKYIHDYYERHSHTGKVVAPVISWNKPGYALSKL